jgi:hypothetical protein
LDLSVHLVNPDLVDKLGQLVSLDLWAPLDPLDRLDKRGLKGA